MRYRYEPGGVVSSAMLLLVFNYITPVLKVFNVFPWFNRHVLSRFVYSLPRMASLWTPEPFDVGRQMAYTLKTTALGLTYGAIYPPAYLITAFGLLLSWLCTRCGMRYWYMKPAAVNQKMMMEMRLRLGQVVGIATCLQCTATWRAMGNEKGSLASGGVILIGAPLLCALYVAVPLGCFKAFATFDQLSEAGGLLDTIVDGEPLRFDLVTQTTGQDVPPYLCPILAKQQSSQRHAGVIMARRIVRQRTSPRLFDMQTPGALAEKALYVQQDRAAQP